MAVAAAGGARHWAAGLPAAAASRRHTAAAAASGTSAGVLAARHVPAARREGSAFFAAAAAATAAAARGRRVRAARRAAEGQAPEAAVAGAGEAGNKAKAPQPTAAEMRQELVNAPAPAGGYTALSEGQRSAVSGFFFPDSEELDMDKSMPLEDHLRELRDGVLRAAAALVLSVGICLYFYKELTTWLELPVQTLGVKLIQLAPGEFFFVSVKAAVAVGLLLAFPYALFEAALYFTPALTKSERGVVGPVVLASSVLFYSGVAFAFAILSPAALGFFVSYSQDLIESQFSIDQYFEFILSMGFATGLAFQVPVLQVTLGLLNIIKSEQLLSVWRYVIVLSAVVGAVLTPSTDPVTQLLLSSALCALYFAGAGTLAFLGR